MRAAIAAAAYENNFDPLIALKIVLAAAPPRRRGEMRKKRLDAFLNADLDTLLDEARKHKTPHISTRSHEIRRKTEEGADAAAMAALNAGMPGRALRRLSQTGTLGTSQETIAVLSLLHPASTDPLPCTDYAPIPTLATKHISTVLKAMRQSAAGPSGLRADHLLAYPSGFSDCLSAVLTSIAEGRAPR